MSAALVCNKFWLNPLKISFHMKIVFWRADRAFLNLNVVLSKTYSIVFGHTDTAFFKLNVISFTAC